MPKLELVDFENTNQFNKLILDYAKNKPELNPFFELRPDFDAYQQAINNKKFTASQRQLLVNELKHQYKNNGIALKATDLTLTQIELLNQPNCYTITTGHQLCLFTGPLYFIHKIISTIQWCNQLNERYTENKFVPIFWMASEDHDFEEVNHFNTHQKKYTWEINSQNKPVGQLELSQLIKLFSQWSELGKNKFSEGQLHEMMDCYRSSANLAEATRKLVHLFFKDYGLVIVDGDSKALKTPFVEVIKKDILGNETIEKVNQTSTLLKKLGYKTQVNAREINFFYLSQHGRNLIKPNKKGYVIDGTSLSFTKAQIEKEIEEFPEKFSPNVVLRPLYQESILPNLSYIGGPGEIAYWLQLKSMFASYQVSFPILTLRNFVTIFSEKDYKKTSKLNLTTADLFANDTQIRNQIIDATTKLNYRQTIKDVDDNLQKLINFSVKIDNKISSAIIQQKKRTNKELTKITKLLNKQLSLKNKKQIQVALEIKGNYFRKNIPQERYLNIMEFGQHQSIPALIQTINTATKPNQHGIQVIIMPI